MKKIDTFLPQQTLTTTGSPSNSGIKYDAAARVIRMVTAIVFDSIGSIEFIQRSWCYSEWIFSIHCSTSSMEFRNRSDKFLLALLRALSIAGKRLRHRTMVVHSKHQWHHVVLGLSGSMLQLHGYVFKLGTNFKESSKINSFKLLKKSSNVQWLTCSWLLKFVTFRSENSVAFLAGEYFFLQWFSSSRYSTN